MPYKTVIAQVKMLSEPLLASVSTFNKLLELRKVILLKITPIKQRPKKKQAFFALAGELPLDQNAVTELREVSLI